MFQSLYQYNALLGNGDFKKIYFLPSQYYIVQVTKKKKKVFELFWEFFRDSERSYLMEYKLMRIHYMC